MTLDLDTLRQPAEAAFSFVRSLADGDSAASVWCQKHLGSLPDAAAIKTGATILLVTAAAHSMPLKRPVAEYSLRAPTAYERSVQRAAQLRPRLR